MSIDTSEGRPARAEAQVLAEEARALRRGGRERGLDDGRRHRRADRGKGLRWAQQTLEGSLSALSKPNFASKYAFESSRRDLHNALLCTTLQSHVYQNV